MDMQSLGWIILILVCFHEISVTEVFHTGHLEWEQMAKTKTYRAPVVSGSSEWQRAVAQAKGTYSVRASTRNGVA